MQNCQFHLKDMLLLCITCRGHPLFISMLVFIKYYIIILCSHSKFLLIFFISRKVLEKNTPGRKREWQVWRRWKSPDVFQNHQEVTQFQVRHQNMEKPLKGFEWAHFGWVRSLLGLDLCVFNGSSCHPDTSSVLLAAVQDSTSVSLGVRLRVA